jgi:hypothetical protein
MIRNSLLLSVDLILIMGLFGVTGYYYTANIMGAGEWYALQYDVDVLATNMQMAAATNGMVNMTMTLPAQAYISVMNDDLTSPSYGLVIGQQVHSSRTIEWALLNSMLDSSDNYNQRGYAYSSVTNGFTTILKEILMDKSEITYTQITVPTYGATIRNTDDALKTGFDPDTSTQFAITLDGMDRAQLGDHYYNVVKISYEVI